MGLGGVGHRESEPRPWSSRVQGAFVVPGAKQTEDFAAKVAREQTVHFIEAPDKMTGQFAKDFAAQVTFEICVGAAALIPDIFRQTGQLQLVGHEFAQGQVKSFHGGQMAGVQLLKVGQHHLGSRLSGLLQPARQQRGLSHLPRALHQHDAVLPHQGIVKFLVGGAHDVEVRIKRHRAANRFQFQTRL